MFNVWPFYGMHGGRPPLSWLMPTRIELAPNLAIVVVVNAMKVAQPYVVC